MPPAIKPVAFVGNALDELRALPGAARRALGYQIDRVQRGYEPDDWKPMNAIGQGVREIRVRDTGGAFRAVYVAKLADAIFVLHCFRRRRRRHPAWTSNWPAVVTGNS